MTGTVARAAPGQPAGGLGDAAPRPADPRAQPWLAGLVVNWSMPQPAAPPAAWPAWHRAHGDLRAQRHLRAVPRSERSVLDLADACDVPARWSCRTGVCHTCITPLLSGDVTYAPDPPDPPPATCSSAAPGQAPTSS
jgi:ferredoxin